MEFDLLVAGDSNKSSDSALAANFPQFPGEYPLAHSAQEFQEKAENALASLGLLAVVQGQELASAKSIVDIDLSLLPELPPDHRDYNRRLESRMRIISLLSTSVRATQIPTP